ncbi:TRAP transporter substrate-binding protein [Desulfoscipio geothermicus]|uniref:Tripartite ATP-independent transporter solute receptor, DctP family n=1 Tax=Desulfoscipio geothermicus DSM 3669 TaxID=1121426 RepID=A0A1I6D610_9FIRM|nr:TRAP transporter substrate-binding protein [Desulfoscipio geothermicus]SFR00870.1 tripartite ATP-independent transporter solute receptor, DctP family [Desulfoscipio geothermicus DSM 3669]
MRLNKAKCIILLMSLLIASLFLFGCQSSKATEDGQATQEEPIIIKLAHVCSIEHPYQYASLKFKELMEEKSNGRVKVKIYPAMQLGGERDIAEGMQAGSIDMNLLTLGVGASFIPELNAFALPFLFKGSEHYQKVMYGDIGKEFLEKVDMKYGFKTLHFGASIFREPFNNVRPIEKPEDFKGLKIRLMEVPLHMDSYKAMGANPTPIAYSELYTALQLGTVDGAENAIGTIYADKLYENAKYITRMPVVANGVIWLYSANNWEKLPQDIQELIIEVMPEVVSVLDKEYLKLEDIGIEEMKKAGIQFNKPEDFEPFIKCVKPVWDKYLAEQPDWVKDLIPKIQTVD